MAMLEDHYNPSKKQKQRGNAKLEQKKKKREKHCKHSSRKKRNGDTQLGYLGRMCNVMKCLKAGTVESDQRLIS
jgi:hypothetical protein